MNGHIREQIVAYLADELAAVEREDVKEHLAICESCRQEFNTLTSLWTTLGLFPDESPGDGVKAHFEERLTAYEQMIHRAAAIRRPPALAFMKAGWRSAIQAGIGLAILALGMFIGTRLSGPTPPSGAIAELRDEIANLKTLLTVSLLQQQSASERLRGISWADRAGNTDSVITSALLATLRFDPNINVRLSALDALAHQIGDPAVRDVLIGEMERQQSPMMQIAIIDKLVLFRERQSVGAMRDLLRRPRLNDDVRKRITEGLRQLT